MHYSHQTYYNHAEGYLAGQTYPRGAIITGSFQSLQITSWSFSKVIIRKAIKSSLEKREEWLQTSVYMNQPKVQMSRVRWADIWCEDRQKAGKEGKGR